MSFHWNMTALRIGAGIPRLGVELVSGMDPKKKEKTTAASPIVLSLKVGKEATKSEIVHVKYILICDCALD